MDALSWKRLWGPALVVALFFVFRFVLLTNSILMTPEECHTGGIASELLKHGVQFPLRAYTPETYENGIVVEGFLAAGFFTLFGKNIFALKLLAFATSLAGVFLSLALLRRVLDAAEVKSSRARLMGIAFACLVLAVAPATFVYKAMDALGDHNEGSVLSLLLLWLLVRRIESPGWLRWGVLWLLVGVCVAWEKGSASVGLLAGIYELLAMRKDGVLSGLKRIGGALVLSAAGYSPAFFVAYETRGGDWRTVAGKFLVSSARELLERYARFFVRLWMFLDQNPIQAAIFLVSLGWLIWRLRRPKTNDPATWLAAFAVFQLVMVSLAETDGPKLWYLQYVFYMVPIGGGWLVARLSERAEVGARWKLGIVPTAMTAMGVALIAMHPGLKPSLSAAGEMYRDEGHAVCYSRFGRAFWQVSGANMSAAVSMCRRLEGDATLSCLTGLNFRPGEFHPQEWPASERPAMAFGAGREWSTEMDGRERCSGVYADDPANERLCHAGRRWECVQYAQLVSRFMMIDLVQGRPSCEMSPPWKGFEVAAAERFPTWGGDEKSELPRRLFEGPDLEGCGGALKECFTADALDAPSIAGEDIDTE